jgi:hypothetical protein
MIVDSGAQCDLWRINKWRPYRSSYSAPLDLLLPFSHPCHSSTKTNHTSQSLPLAVCTQPSLQAFTRLYFLFLFLIKNTWSRSHCLFST